MHTVCKRAARILHSVLTMRLSRKNDDGCMRFLLSEGKGVTVNGCSTCCASATINICVQCLQQQHDEGISYEQLHCRVSIWTGCKSELNAPITHSAPGGLPEFWGQGQGLGKLSKDNSSKEMSP